MPKFLLTILLLTLTLNATKSIPIKFYEDSNVNKDKSKFTENSSLLLEVPTKNSRTKLFEGEKWEVEYKSRTPMKKRNFIESIKKKIVTLNGTISYESKSFVHASVMHDGNKYWVAITYRDPTTYVVRLLKEKKKERIKTVKKVSIDLGKDRFRFYGLKFDSGKDILLDSSEDDLNKIEKLMREIPSVVILIEGHTDAKGSAKSNQLLSEKRALAVKHALEERGIASNRLEYKGFGETKLLPNATDAENRRVEIVKLKGTEKSKKVTVDIEQFTEIEGYKKTIHKLNNGEIVRAFYEIIDNEHVSSIEKIIVYYEKIITNLGGKVTFKDQKKLTFDFDKEVSGKLSIVKNTYYISLNYKKGKK